MEYFINIKQFENDLIQLHNQLKIEAETKPVKDAIYYTFRYHKEQTGSDGPFKYLRNDQIDKDYLEKNYYNLVKFFKDNEKELMKNNGHISRVFLNVFSIFSTINNIKEQIKNNDMLLQEFLSKINTEKTNQCVQTEPIRSVQTEPVRSIQTEPVISRSLDDIDVEETVTKIIEPSEEQVNHPLLALYNL